MKKGYEISQENKGGVNEQKRIKRQGTFIKVACR